MPHIYSPLFAASDRKPKREAPMATLQNFDAEIAKTKQVVQDMRTKIEQSGTVLDTLATAGSL